MTEHEQGHTPVVVVATLPVRSPVLEALTLARELGPVVVLVLGSPQDAAVRTLAAHGAQRVLSTDLGEAGHVPAVAGRAVATAVESVGADLVLAPSSFASKEVAAHAAFLLDAGLLIDVATIRSENERYVGGKRVFAGTWDTQCAVTSEIAVVTLRPNAVTAAEVAAPGEVSPEPLAVDAGLPRGLEVVSRTEHPRDEGRPALAEAAYVVAGGRGTEGDFSAVDALAQTLGAAVGTTRDCVDEGWQPHDAQIGQTGITIAPRVYIGAGISGAPHHHGGMQASQVIIAVNDDADAPLVQIADFAVIGDLQEILPAATAALARHRQA